MRDQFHLSITCLCPAYSTFHISLHSQCSGIKCTCARGKHNIRLQHVSAEKRLWKRAKMPHCAKWMDKAYLICIFIPPLYLPSMATLRAPTDRMTSPRPRRGGRTVRWRRGGPGGRRWTARGPPTCPYIIGHNWRRSSKKQLELSVRIVNMCAVTPVVVSYMAKLCEFLPA